MKITVELSETDMKAICRVTGIKKKGPAIRHLVETALKLEKRREVATKFMNGNWGTDLEGFEESRVADKKKAGVLDSAWRD